MDMNDMGMHPNWIGLATTIFERKIFIRAGEDPPNNIKIKKYNPPNNYLNNGDDVKNMYVDIISEPSKTKYKAKSLKNLEKNKSKINDETESSKIQDTHQKPTDKIIQKFLLAAQENNIIILNDVLGKYPGVLNAVDKYGWTAIMCSTQSRAMDAVKFLINNNADVSLRENTGKTALDLMQKNSDIYNMLTKKLNIAKSICNTKKKEFVSNRKIHCDICNDYYEERDKNKHFTSILHSFSSSKKTKTKTYYGIPEHNRGYQILLKNGWDREYGLGPKGTGSKFPLKTVHKVDRHGLGNKTETPRVTHTSESINEKDKRRVENYRTLRKKHRRKIVSNEKLLEQSIRRSLS